MMADKISANIITCCLYYSGWDEEKKISSLSPHSYNREYLKLIPHAWKLIEYRINNNNLFKELKKKLDYYFPKKIRKKNES